MANLTRQQIINGNYRYPKHLIELNYSKHFKDRFSERGLSLDYVPSLVRITPNNIHSGKVCDCNKNRLTSVVIRIPYNGKKFMFLAMSLDGTVKTIWFNGSRKHRKPA